jgi:hypothetical protein
LLLALLLTVGVTALAPAAAQASFGFQNFGAGTCSGTPPLGHFESTLDGFCPNFFTQAGGTPDYAVTSFSLNLLPNTEQPDGILNQSRVDLPPGLTTNPQAVPQCTDAEFPNCPADTQVGEVDLSAWPATVLDAQGLVTAPVYNMVPPAGQPSDFAFTAGLGSLTIVPRVDIHGGIRSNTGNSNNGASLLPSDFGQYFTITNSPATLNVLGLVVPLAPVSTTLYFFGDPTLHDTGTPGKPFITMPSLCNGPQTTVAAANAYDQPTFVQTTFTTPVGAMGCNQLSLTGQYAPTLSAAPVDASGQVVSSAAHDSPTGLKVSLSVPQPENQIPHPQGFAGIATPLIKKIEVALPPGFSINPAAGANVQACTDAQFGVDPHTGAQTGAKLACPDQSVVGSVSIHSPDLPNALVGTVYLGAPTASNPFRVFVDAGQDVGTDVRLQGTISADADTGQLVTTFDNNPQIAFDNLTLIFNGGPNAVLASPLACGPAQMTSLITAYSGATAQPSATIAVDGNGAGGACPSPTPFGPSVSMSDATTQAGAPTTMALSISRPDGQQYLSHITAQLPPGLVGSVASVQPCPEAGITLTSANCPSYSKVGSAVMQSGAGPAPLTLSAPVFLTGPYKGAPFGLVIPVPATVGPFDLGTVVVRAGISVSPTDGHLIITSDVPSILDGIPLRVRSVVISVDRPNFLQNGTNCSPQSGSGSFTSTGGATFNTTFAPLTLTGCSQLGFSPSITATTDASASTTVGADLDVKVTATPGQANMRSVAMTLPKQLSPRLPTIQGACLKATFAANPASCPATSVVGTATASTPVLSAPLSGSVYLVANGNALPTVNVPLSGGGVTFNLVGSVSLSSTGAATTTFGAAATGFLPDVPIASLELKLPEGPHSLLSPSGALCPGPLPLKAALVGQNGTSLNKTTNITVIACPKASSVKVQAALLVISKRFVSGHLQVTVNIGAGGRVSVSGDGLHTTRHTFGKSGRHTLTVKLTNAAASKLHRHRTVKLKIRIGYVPSKAGRSSSVNTGLTIKG